MRSPHARSIAHAFAACEARPEAIALFDGERRVTYAQLATRSAQIAASLARRGIEPGDHVGVALDRSIELVATLLSVWRLGAVVVPIDPAWPAERRAMVVADAELRHLIDAPVDVDACEQPLADVAPDAVALALYTSGSTGEPNAVVLAHRALLWRLHALALAVPYAPDDIACHRTPPTFIDAYAEVLGPLLHGIATFVAPHLTELGAAIHRERVTRLLTVPSLLGVLLDAGDDLASLRIVATSGEALTESLARRFYAACPQARLFNIYGSTEVAGDATFAEIASPVPDRIPIGRALAGVEVQLVDEAGFETSLQTTGIGEIVVAGPVVAEGYWNRPALTAARFSRDTAGRQRFRTGDLARWQPDGQLVLVGRVDDQVKIAGVRVELGEIERALLGHPSVRAAAVSVDRDRPRLIAGIVCDGDLEAVRSHLRATLPAAAIPSLLACLDTIPVNGHGKIDRHAVAANVTAALARGTDRFATVEDTLVAKITHWFSELAGRPAHGDDDLVAIGGDSLARLGLLVKLDRAGWHLEHADLPRPLTANALAAQLRTWPQHPPEAAPALARDRLSDFQRVMALESLANAGTAMWSDQLAYTIDGELDPDRFERAWREVIAAEPALRTAIEVRDGELVQRVHDEVGFVLARIDLRGRDLEAVRLQVLAEEWTRLSLAFTLDRAPLFEVCLLSNAARSDMIFTYHHVILDGESARRVLRAVLAAYAGTPLEPSSQIVGKAMLSIEPFRARLGGYTHVAEPEPKIAERGDFVWRLFHWILRLRARIATARVRRATKRKTLRRLLESSRLQPSVYAGGDLVSQPIATSLQRAIAAWAAAGGTTATAVWATAYALHLARERGVRDVMFGVVVAGRDGRSAHAIGMLANCLPLRVKFDVARSAAAVATEVGAGLEELERLAATPLLALAPLIDPRAFLDTMFTSWAYRPDEVWSVPEGLAIRGGRGVTLTVPRTALIVSGGELAVGARALHRTDRIRRDVLAVVEAMLDGTPVGQLLALPACEAGMSVGVATL